MPEDVVDQGPRQGWKQGWFSKWTFHQNICGMFTCLVRYPKLFYWCFEILGNGRREVASGEWSGVMHNRDPRHTGKIEQVCGSNVQTVYCNITHATVAEDFLKAKFSHGIWALSDFDMQTLMDLKKNIYYCPKLGVDMISAQIYWPFLFDLLKSHWLLVSWFHLKWSVDLTFS